MLKNVEEVGEGLKRFNTLQLKEITLFEKISFLNIWNYH
jgi:hypothetical protein